MGALQTVSTACGYIMGIIGLVLFIFKPFKTYLSILNKVVDGQKCQLRSDMLRVYYRHKDEKKIRQYEKENFLLEYSAYKSLKGNSFIDDVEKEMRSWEVTT